MWDQRVQKEHMEHIQFITYGDKQVNMKTNGTKLKFWDRYYS